MVYIICCNVSTTKSSTTAPSESHAMKIKTLAVLLLLVIAIIIGSYTSQDAKAQVWAGIHPALKYMSVVMLDDGTGNLVPTVRLARDSRRS